MWVDPADAEVSVPIAAVARLRKLRQFKGQADMSGPQYEAALRRQHTVLNPRTNWADSKAAKAAAARSGPGPDVVIDDEREPDESSAQQLLLSGSGLLLQGGAAAGGLLAPGSIEMSRLRDANGSSPSDAVVQALQFHPNGQLMLTGSFDKRLKLFQVCRTGPWVHAGCWFSGGWLQRHATVCRMYMSLGLSVCLQAVEGGKHTKGFCRVGIRCPGTAGSSGREMVPARWLHQLTAHAAWMAWHCRSSSKSTMPHWLLPGETNTSRELGGAAP